MTISSVFLLLVNCVLFSHAMLAVGKFGDKPVPIDIEMDGHKMWVTVHKPDNAPDTFRETTNLHIFPQHMVAIRNSIDKHCYVHYFPESMDLIKGRLENAAYNHGVIGNVTMESLSVARLPTLSSRTVNLVLGEFFAKFCESHDVYFVGEEDTHTLYTQDLDVKVSGHQITKEIVFGGICSQCKPPVLV